MRAFNGAQALWVATLHPGSGTLHTLWRLATSQVRLLCMGCPYLFITPTMMCDAHTGILRAYAYGWRRRDPPTSSLYHSIFMAKQHSAYAADESTSLSVYLYVWPLRSTLPLV